MNFEEKYLFPKILPQIHRKYPDFEITIITKSSLEIENALLKNVADVSLVVMHKNQQNDELEYIPVKEYQILVAVPLEHELAKDYKYPPDDKTFPEIDLTLLANESFIWKCVKDCVNLHCHLI